MTYAELNELALKAESGADWAEIARLEAEMLTERNLAREEYDAALRRFNSGVIAIDGKAFGHFDA